MKSVAVSLAYLVSGVRGPEIRRRHSRWQGEVRAGRRRGSLKARQTPLGGRRKGNAVALHLLFNSLLSSSLPHLRPRLCKDGESSSVTGWDQEKEKKRVEAGQTGR